MIKYDHFGSIDVSLGRVGLFQDILTRDILWYWPMAMNINDSIYDCFDYSMYKIICTNMFVRAYLNMISLNILIYLGRDGPNTFWVDTETIYGT